VEREQQGDTFYSFAALDRAATDRELGAEVSADLASFRAAARTPVAPAPRATRGVLHCSERSHGGAPEAGASFIVRRAVAGRPAAEEPDYVQLRNQLLTLLAEARSRGMVGVLVKSSGNTHLADLRRQLREEPGDAARRRRLREAARSANLTDATQLQWIPRRTAAEGSLGEKWRGHVHLVAPGVRGWHHLGRRDGHR